MEQSNWDRLLEGKHQNYTPIPKDGAEYSYQFDSDILAYDKEETDNENKNLRTWNLNYDVAIKKQASLFMFPSYEVVPKIASPSMTSFQGFTIQPLKNLKLDYGENQIRLIDKSNKAIERCTNCKAYLNPYITLTHRNRNWTCACCGCMNSLVGEYFNFQDGSFDDEKEKVELTNDVFEYYVPDNYAGCYDKRKDKLVIVIDVSKQALLEGEIL